MYFDAYQIAVSSDDNNSFTFVSDNINRTLYCPMKNMIKTEGKHHKLEKTTCEKYGWGSVEFFKKPSITNAMLARRLWDCLWEEGWREKPSRIKRAHSAKIWQALKR